MIKYNCSIVTYILLYKVVSFFCLKLKISITTEPIEFSFLRKLYIAPVIDLDQRFVVQTTFLSAPQLLFFLLAISYRWLTTNFTPPI